MMKIDSPLSEWQIDLTDRSLISYGYLRVDCFVSRRSQIKFFAQSQSYELIH
jgi:hypothetical protein